MLDGRHNIFLKQMLSDNDRSLPQQNRLTNTAVVDGVDDSAMSGVECWICSASLLCISCSLGNGEGICDSRTWLETIFDATFGRVRVAMGL